MGRRALPSSRSPPVVRPTKRRYHACVELADRITHEARRVAREEALSDLDRALQHAEEALTRAHGRCEYRPAFPSYVRDKLALRLIPGLGRIFDRALEFFGSERVRTDLDLLEGQIRLLAVCRRLRAELERTCALQEERLDSLAAAARPRNGDA